MLKPVSDLTSILKLRDSGKPHLAISLVKLTANVHYSKEVRVKEKKINGYILAKSKEVRSRLLSLSLP